VFVFADAVNALSPAQALKKLDIEGLLLPVLFQLVLIIAVARIFGNLARRVGQPAAVGEIIAGLILGPSLLGWLFPEISAMVFRPELHGVPQDLANAAFPKIFQVFAQLGLVLLLFLIGLEFDFEHLKVKGRAALGVSLTGILFPFSLGLGLAFLIHQYLEPYPKDEPVPFMGFALFMGVSMSITAIPILGRMMIELGINRTKLAAIVITAAAVDDAAGWILLATVAAVVRSGFNLPELLKMIGLTVGFALFMLYIVRPLLVRYFSWSLQGQKGQLSLNALAVLLVTLILCSIATNLIGIFAIFGAFILGAVLSDQVEFREAVATRLRDFVTAFFLPVFFTYTGLNTNIGSLSGGNMWLIGLGVMGAAIIGKFGGCAIAARLSGIPSRESVIIGVMMNTRALMELIVINAGKELGVIPPSVFTMLVMMAVVTTIMTTPILLLLRRGTELEEPIAQSGFLGLRPQPVTVG
jgi:Kef-type K+ transport system membrane component KefB